MRWVCLVLALPMLVACKSQSAPAPQAGASATSGAAQADPLQAMLDTEGRLLIDVRTPREFASGHVPGSINIPLSQLPAIEAKLGRKDQPAVLFCRTGNRSGQAIRALKAKGYTNLVNGFAAPDLAAKLGLKLAR